MTVLINRLLGRAEPDHRTIFRDFAQTLERLIGRR